MKEKARIFAIKSHGDQRYGNLPYSFHLDSVAKIADRYGELACTLAYLHDVVEDTDVTLDQLEAEFGHMVARCVSILTDEPGANRKERKAKTYEKMSKVSGDLEIALIVKVCDRLANVTACVSEQNARLLQIYRREHDLFRDSVFRDGLCNELWVELEEMLAT